MIKYIYVFGSICRGEIDEFSDIDLLIINDEPTFDEYLKKHSLYHEETIRNLWFEGNPFAWHLYSEAKNIFSYDSTDLFQELGKPSPYRNIKNDFNNLMNIFRDASKSISQNTTAVIFDLSVIFLVVRNIATCYELATMNRLNFSRDSALKMTNNPLCINEVDYQTIKICRLISTRGIGVKPSNERIENALRTIPIIENWIYELNKNLEYESV